MILSTSKLITANSLGMFSQDKNLLYMSGRRKVVFIFLKLKLKRERLKF
jgi:hypothetical protein